MSDEEDFSKIPLATRWSHAKWKARASAYEESATSSKAGGNLPSPDNLKSACSDSNVIALEAGIKLAIVVFNLIPTSNTSLPLNYCQSVASSLAEKGLVAIKPSVKQAALEALLLLVAAGDPAVVVDAILPLLSAKPPKTVAAGVNALAAIFTDFGSPVTDPQPVLKVLPAQFNNADKNVRLQALSLATGLSRWIGAVTIQSVLAQIKPVLLKDVMDSVAKIDMTANPKRLTRSQQQQIDAAANANAGVSGGESVAGDASVSPNDANSEPGEGPQIDPWNFAEPQDVLSQLPGDFFEMLKSSKWKERHEALQKYLDVLDKTTRMIPQGDYDPLISELLRIASTDANVACASLAVNCLSCLAAGLRKPYGPNAVRTAEAVLERYKEKKPAMITAITQCLDAVFFRVMNNHFGAMFPVLSSGVGHKFPGVRMESIKYTAHLISISPVLPKWADVEPLAKAAPAFLADSTEPMRDAAALLLATLIKAAGSARIEPLLKSVDDHRRQRITKALESVTIRANSGSAPAAAQPAAAAATAARPTPGVGVGVAATSKAGAPTARSAAATRPGGPAQVKMPVPAPASGMVFSQRPKPFPKLPLAVQTGAFPPSTPRRDLELSDADVDGVVGELDDFMVSPQPREQRSRGGRPSISSTPKVAKRSSARAELTPVHNDEWNRRRIHSPERADNSMDGFRSRGPGSDDKAALTRLMTENARLTARLKDETAQRLEIEKRLASVEVAKDRKIQSLRSELDQLRLLYESQKSRFEASQQRRNDRESTRLGHSRSSSRLDLSRTELGRTELGRAELGRANSGRSDPGRNRMRDLTEMEAPSALVDSRLSSLNIGTDPTRSSRPIATGSTRSYARSVLSHSAMSEVEPLQTRQSAKLAPGGNAGASLSRAGSRGSRGPLPTLRHNTDGFSTSESHEASTPATNWDNAVNLATDLRQRVEMLKEHKRSFNTGTGARADGR